MPEDLKYIALVESALRPHAGSRKGAVGFWQFTRSTGRNYGLKIDSEKDERRNIFKSTDAAIEYLKYLYKTFGSWTLAAAAYNMGETRLKKLIKKYDTKNFWALSKKEDFPRETRDYIPKLMAALLIAKAPQLYDFSKVKTLEPYSYESFHVPGGTDLQNMATRLNINPSQLKRLNPELVHGFVPKFVNSHRIRIPPGMTTKVSKYIRKKL